MSYTLLIHAEAIIDIQSAFEWLQEKREGLGFEFIEEVEACYYSLSKNPQHYTYINDKYRRIKVNRFPYLIVYEIEDDRIIINSVLHAKRKL